MIGLDALISGIEHQFGKENIRALYQFGAHELPAVRKHELHLLLVLEDGQLVRSNLPPKLTKGIASIQIFNVSELATASDVFPLEFMDLKWGRELLVGTDVLADVVIQGANIRHEAEFYTRSVILRLRAAVATNLSPTPVIAYGVSDVIRSIRGLLNQNEAGRVRTPEEVVNRMETWLKHPLPELKKSVTSQTIQQVDVASFLDELIILVKNIDQL